MIFCLSRSFCEPKPKDIEHSYQCCNSCNNRKCTNRCKDDCNTCGLVADQEFIDSLKPKVEAVEEVAIIKPKKAASKKQIVNSNIEVEKPTKRLVSEEEKREARRRRRMARKNKK